MSSDDKSIKLLEQFNDSAQELFQRGLKLLGPVTGATFGVITKDPAAIVLSAAIGDSISQVVNDYSQRVLSKKEKDNISITEIFAIAQIIKNQNAGLPIHSKLFEPGITGNAKELYEGILTFAKNNWEDKKLEILGKMYAGILFSPALSPALFGLLISRLNALTYQQICLISIIGQHEKYMEGLAPVEALMKKDNWYEVRMIQNVISNFMNDGTFQPHETALLIPVQDRHLNKSRLSTIGDLLFKVAELHEVDEEDLQDILGLFRLP